MNNDTVSLLNYIYSAWLPALSRSVVFAVGTLRSHPHPLLCDISHQHKAKFPTALMTEHESSKRYAE